MDDVEEELWNIFTFYTLRGGPSDLTRLSVSGCHYYMASLYCRSTAAVGVYESWPILRCASDSVVAYARSSYVAVVLDPCVHTIWYPHVATGHKYIIPRKQYYRCVRHCYIQLVLYL